MATIKDVAQYANVSVATVSRYLNEKGYISDQAKQQIQMAIEALQYKPNHIARSLSKKQSKLIGLIVPDIQNPYFPHLARAVEDTARHLDYTVVLCNSDGQVEKEQHYIESLSQQYVAGLLVATTNAHPSLYKKVNIPIVAIDREIDESIPAVVANNFDGAFTAAKYLLKTGAKNILFVRGPKEVSTATQREEGFYKALQHNEAVQVRTIVTQFDFKEATKAIQHIIEQDTTIDSIFASSDTIAIAAMKVLQSMNKKIPKDIQIIGFDGIELGAMVSPELTTICQDIYTIGQEATKMLMKLIDGEQVQQHTVIVDTKLIVRETTRKERT